MPAPPSPPFPAPVHRRGLDVHSGPSASDGDGITEWVVNWGDGSVQVASGTTSSLNHVYADGPSSRTIKATAIDGDGSLAVATQTVTVVNVAPTLTVTGDGPTAEGSLHRPVIAKLDPVRRHDIAVDDQFGRRRDSDVFRHVYRNTPTVTTAPALPRSW